MLRRAPRLRFFKTKGLYLRPSLPKAERDRLRQERAARRQSRDNVNVVHVDSVQTQPSTSDHVVDNVCTASNGMTANPPNM
ncbi:hypothetical protein Y032_0001g261 [Ancylostoma ceylanicum]|nr:hypothetical protein Y032_0001g261 [Ancylostoma ceylanicum]